MAKATSIDVSALAKKYAKPRVQCLMCKLNPEHAATLRELRFAHGLSYDVLQSVLADEFKLSICSSAIRQHFITHERKAA